MKMHFYAKLKKFYVSAIYVFLTLSLRDQNSDVVTL